MNKGKKNWEWAGAMGFCLALMTASGSLAAPLSDRIEAVIIKGEGLPAEVWGGPVGDYRLFAFDGATLAPIPFQIDERNDKGELILQGGTRTDTGDGKFGPADDLVFMAADAGGFYTGPAPEGCATTATISLNDPAVTAAASVIIAKCQQPPPASPKSYVKFDPNTRMAATDRYRMGWEKQYAFYYDTLAVGKGPDLLDRLKVRISLGALGVYYTFNEENHFDYTFVGYKAGPVRVVTESTNRVKLGPFGLIPVPQTISFFPNHVELINQLDTSLNPAVLGLEFIVAIGHDHVLDQLGAKAAQYKICTNTMESCRPYLDKLPPEKLKEINEKDTVWGGYDGPDGAWIAYIVPDPKLSTNTRSLYIDDPAAENPPETYKGSSPLLSFNVVNWQDVPAGTYHLDFYHFFIDDFSPAKVESCARLVTQPLKVSVK